MSLAELSDIPGKVESLIAQCAYIEDAVAAFSVLTANQDYSLLLDSAEIDSKDNLKSLILLDAALRLECWGNEVTITALTSNGQSVLPLFDALQNQQVEVGYEQQDTVTLRFATIDPNLDEDSRLKATTVFDALRAVITSVKPIREIDSAVFLGGVFGYDLLAVCEPLPTVATGLNDCPDFVFYLAETLIQIDHQQHTTQLIGNVFSGPDVAQQYFRVSQRLEQITQQLQSEQSSLYQEQSQAVEVHLDCDKTDEQFCNDVNDLKEHILAGDIFQVVPSRTFSLPCPSPLMAYRELKTQNPSPYMFFMKDKGFQLFGASPESALKYTAESREVEIYPIAGTRARGKWPDGRINLDLDSRIELELRQDEKEKAEHLMLVDLARNDVARVCEPGTRHVKDLLKVDRYSHVMHLVSRVVGVLRDDLDALHAYQACMNMGTLVGAPKVSAAGLIRDVEKTRRGSYGGAVGYINGSGDMDTCIVIRSAFVKQGKAYIQAGAGVVYDSDPQSEADETRSKAQAVISAIQAASAVQEDNA
ncbi:anthranilate synthase component 1 [Aestuariibacter salexigens]|uniref:anthranilate synthase component 1 n=1 Tax=Aestuariibacter salexigens TaxID=226010 RepID=UPI0004204568|nr:anthranilate synthase component 1 [Aestuariibacter salexigens]